MRTGQRDMLHRIDSFTTMAETRKVGYTHMHSGADSSVARIYEINTSAFRTRREDGDAKKSMDKALALENVQGRNYSIVKYTSLPDNVRDGFD
jgi:hypothetical protein